MAQQINLFNPELSPKREVLTAGLMAGIILVFALLLGVYGWSLAQQADKLSRQRDDWVQRVQNEQNRLVQVTQQNPPRVASLTLPIEIKTAEEKLHDREKAFEMLRNGMLGSGSGFSTLLQGFARQSVNGLWLTGISSNGAGDQMRISGRALFPELISQYISQLSTEPVLSGRKFTTFEIRQPKQDDVKDPKAVAVTMAPAYIEFALAAEKPMVQPAPGAKP